MACLPCEVLCACICLRDVDGFLQCVSGPGGTQKWASHFLDLGWKVRKVRKGRRRSQWLLTGLCLPSGPGCPIPPHSSRSKAWRARVQSPGSCISEATEETGASQFFPEGVGKAGGRPGFPQTKPCSPTAGLGPSEMQQAGSPRPLSQGPVTARFTERARVPAACLSGFASLRLCGAVLGKRGL